MNDPPDILSRRGLPPASATSSTGGQHFVITSPMQQVTLSQSSSGSVQLHRVTSGAGGSGRLVTRSPAGMARPASVTGVPATLYGTPNSKLAARTSPQQPRKKIKLEERLSSSDEVTLKRQNVLDYKLDRAAKLREQYDELTAELYYLEDGGSLMDFPGWLKRPPLQFLNYKKRMLLDSDDEEDGSGASGAAEVKVPASGGTPVAVSSTLPSSIAKLAHIKGKQLGGRHGMVFGNHQPPPANKDKQPISNALASGGTAAVTPVTPRGPGRPPGSGLGETGTEHMVEKAKQEAQVMQRISDLRKQGIWSEKRLPKVAEPKRVKAHWDYLLEEMQWLAADFAQERKWKKAAARKCARMVQKYHQDKAAAAEKAVKDQERDLRRVAAFVAREIRTFWANAEKLVEFKMTARLDEKRKKALDQHLNFIVDQTEKYSEKLQEALQQNSAQPSRASSSCGQPSSRLHSDGEFEPDSGSEDDEETIARAERELQQHDTTAEVNALQKESEMSLDDVLDQLPPGYWENRHRDVPADAGSSDKDASAAGSDDDFEAASDADSDDEETIAEQEGAEKQQDHAMEISQLEDEGQMPLDELMKKYGGGSSSSAAGPSASTSDSRAESDAEDREGSADEDGTADEDEDDDQEDDGGDEEDGDDEEEEDEDEGEEETEMEIGLKSLLDVNASDDGDATKAGGLSGPAEITDVAALAETFQPKGYTLSSTTVKTPVPFLLKHSLREYQHVGLEWLVTMYDKKLNGILADEMGLGKTIQTIALLAHLACQQGIWGPHLIVVPTSVMLNWEIELKKWCPAFKVLTYYGTQKERRLKRTGWTKQNSFHVCITSYKLVLQDHGSFRRKKWKYLILDEAQNIKNFKSQRWQLLLNFQSQRRLLLTGTPLQNNLMELWSLMHFLMPHVFASHREFKEWFSNPVSGMIEGNTEYNESIIKRLHKVLRPFLLRRLKSEVEKQLPKKYEHAIMCRLSKRQRFLYDEFMSRTKTKETLASGSFLSVINILMQLRKVCNHPDMFEPRPTVSPYRMERLEFVTASCAWTALQHDPFKHVDLKFLNLLLADLEMTLTAFAAHRTRRFQAPRRLIEEVDQRPPPPPRCPAGRIKLHVRATPPTSSAASGPPAPPPARLPAPVPAAVAPAVPRVPAPGGTPLRGYALQVVQGGVVKTIPLSSLSGIGGGPLALQIQQTPQGPRLVPAVSQPVSTGASTTAVSGAITTPVSGGFVLQTGKPLLGQAGPRPLGNGARLAAPATVDPQSLAAMLAARGLPANTNVTFARLTSAAPGGGVAPPRPTTSNALVGSVPTQPAVNAASPQSAPLRPPAPVAPPPPPPPPAPAPPAQPTSLMSPRPTPPPSPGRTTAKSAHSDVKQNSVFRIPSLEEQRKLMRKEKLLTLYRINKRRCEACPIYGADLVQSVRVVDGAGGRVPAWNGLAHCVPAEPRQSGAAATRRYWRHTEPLEKLLPTIPQLLERMQDILSRYVVYSPGVVAPEIRLHVSHPPPWRLQEERWRRLRLTAELSPRAADLHPIASAMATQFPERRLIQYDCGKLQVMDRLLHKLKSEGHRVLIFTQMTRMLDILEQFLNFHGHIYLRLDGTTRVDQRQALMERFNADKRIFCFILSTRSGGVGVNLTGADTVVFYDSDWNPTMDAQAQDRCHRIGQTRDVHIYRLVSDKTIEENIVKKANQKRLLGDLAIEGGNFTTAFFKKNTIQDLFNVDMREDDASRRMSDAARRRPDVKAEPAPPAAPVPDRTAAVAFETALAAAEDETDVRAACTARAEADAEMAEFDENIPLDEAGAGEEEISKAELEVQQLVKQLTPIERWAMAFVEETDDGWQREADRAAAEIDARKREWEADHQQAMRQHDTDSEGAGAGSDSELTYAAEETSQVWISEDGANEMMPVWAPPTPPRDDSDVYMDSVDDLLYEDTPMTEAQLPPVFVRKEPRRIKTEPGVSMPSQPGGSGPSAPASQLLKKPMKVKRDESGGFAPRSLFNRLSPAALKMRRDLRLQQRRTIFSPGTLSLPSAKPALLANKAGLDEHAPEWLVHEDWALLQAIKNVLEMPLNLVVVSPAHTPNWDLVSDLVNHVGRTYRSAKQCRLRFETVVQPREEGKLVYDPSPKKLKKHKLGGPGSKLNLPTAKAGRPLRTSQLAMQDKNQAFSQLLTVRFESMKSIANKRAPTTRPTLLSPANRNPKHAAVLAESGINYDTPLTPVEVAANRATRIAKEKQKSATAEQLQRLQKAQQQAAAAAAAASGSGLVAARQQSLVPARVSAVAVTSAAAGTIVSVSSLTPAQVQVAQRFVSGGLVASSAATKAGIATSIPIQTLTQKSLTPSQLQALKQQTMLRQKLTTLEPLKRLQVATTASAGGGMSAGAVVGASGSVAGTSAGLGSAGVGAAGTSQKVQVAVTSLGTSLGTVTGMAAVPVTQAQARTQVRILKQAAGKQMVAARTMTESEMAAILKQKPHPMQQAQLMPQFLAQVQSAAAARGAGGSSSPATSGATQTVTIPVTAISMAGVTLPHMRAGTPAKVSTASHQQIRQLALPKQLITPQRKLTAQGTQLAQVAGKRVPTQLSAVQIVQGGGQKQLPTTVTVQQIQQVMGRDVIKVPAAAAGGAGTSRASPQQLQARVLPASAAHHPIKQTIQVVSAGSPFASGTAGTATALARPIATLQQARPAAVQLVQPTSQSAGAAGSGQTATAGASQQQQQAQQGSPQLQQTATVALSQLKPLVSAAAAAAGSQSAVRGSPYTMRLRAVSSTASTPDRPSPASTPPAQQPPPQPPPADPAV